MPNGEQRKQQWQKLGKQYSNLTARVYPHQITEGFGGRRQVRIFDEDIGRERTLTLDERNTVYDEENYPVAQLDTKTFQFTEYSMPDGKSPEELFFDDYTYGKQIEAAKKKRAEEPRWKPPAYGKVYPEPGAYWQPPEPEKAFEGLIPRPEEEKREIERMWRKEEQEYGGFPKPLPYEPSPLWGLPKDREPIPVMVDGKLHTLTIDKENKVYDEMNRPVAQFKPDTDEFTRLPEVWWMKVLRAGWIEPTAKALEVAAPIVEKAIYPFTLGGMAMAFPELSTKAITEWGTEVERIKAEHEKGDTSAGEAINQLISTTLSQMTTGLDPKSWLPGGAVYEQFHEFPWWKELLYMTPAFIAGGYGAPTALGIREALKGVAEAGGARAVPAQVARGALLPLEGLERGLRFLPAKVVQRIAKVRWTKVQRDMWTTLDKRVTEIMMEELGVVLKANPQLAVRATPETVSRIASGMARILEARPSFGILRSGSYGITGTISGEAVGAASTRQVARAFAKFTLEWTLPKKPQFAIDILTDAGFKHSAIQGMTVNVAWQNIVKALGLRVATSSLLKEAFSELPDEEVTALVTEIEQLTETKEAIPIRPPEEVIKPPTPEAIGVKPPVAKPGPTVKPAEIESLPYEEQALRVTGIEAEIGGLREWIAFEPATRLKSLIKKAGWHKGEVYDLTIAQYKAFSGKTPLASILTKDKKHVRWEYALDDVATELGYADGDALKEAIESVGEATARISSLQGEMALYAEVPRVTVAKRVPLVDEIRQITLELGTEILAARAAVKGLTGDEARMAREVLTGLQREFTHATKTLEGFRKRPDLPDATKLRQTIMAWARYKGLPQKTLQDIYNKVAGKRQLSVIPQEQLVEILVSVKKARPVRLKGKIVITASTENKIQSLKQTLISEEKLTEEHFGLLMEQLNINTPRYESQFKFITEEQGKQLIRALNDEATVGLVAREIATSKGLKENPAVASAVDDMSARIGREGRVYFEGKPADASVLKDQRFFMEDLETRTGKPFYHTYFLLNRAHLDNRMIFNEIKRRQLESTPKYRGIIRSDESLNRINNYIAAKNKWLKVKSPKDITPDEIALANELETQLFELIPDYRFHRFVNFYQEHKGDIDLIAREIPDAPKGDIRVAVNVFESRGAGQLRAYLDSRTWGVIKSGFEPHYIVNPRLAMQLHKAKFPTGRFKARISEQSGCVEFYPADMNIIQRVDRYTQQVLAYNLQPYVRKLETLYREAIPSLKDPGKIREGISAMCGEMMGYFERGGWLYSIVAKMASQAFLTVFGTFPVLPFRNLFQNPAFFPDKSALIDPRNRKLTDWDWKFYHTYISQMEAIPRDLMLAEEGGLPGLGRFNRFIARVNIYGASDSKINRVWCNWAALNKAERALKQYKLDGDIDRFITSSGMAEMTLTQQADVLRTLTLDEVVYKAPGITPVSGEYAAISEIALEITNNVHFLYDRSQRAIVGMGGQGRIVGSLLVFPRSVVQRILKQFKVLDPASWNPPEKKARAFKVLLAMLIGSMAAGNLFQAITGRKYNPYNPLIMLAWQPGGLALGSVTNLSELVGDIFTALSGDEAARGRIPGSLERVGDTFLPYYKLMISSMESAVGMKKIDRLLAREIQSIMEKQLQEMGFLDEAYKPNRKAYEVERDELTKIQHAIFGTEPEPDPLEAAIKGLTKAEKQLGEFIMVEDSDDGYDYTVTRYAADIRQAIDELPPDEITTEKGFSPFVVWYVNEAKPIDDTYRITPWAERVEEEITSEQAQKLRESFRQHAETEAILFLLGRVKTLQSPDRVEEVEKLLKQHKIPREAVPWLDEYIEKQAEREQEKATKKYQEWERRLPQEPELPLEAVD